MHELVAFVFDARTHPKIVSERMGHASVAMRLDRYTHVSPEPQRATTEALARWLFGAADATTSGADGGESGERHAPPPDSPGNR